MTLNWKKTFLTLTKLHAEYLRRQAFSSRDLYKIRNAPLLEKIVDYLMDNISNAVSANKMANALTSNKIMTNDKRMRLVTSYQNAFRDGVLKTTGTVCILI